MEHSIVERRIVELCKLFRLPAVARDAERSAAEAVRQGLNPLVYLAQLFEIEQEERLIRRATRRVREAKFPLHKTMEGFDFKRAPNLPEAKLLQLADGAYIDAAEPIVFIGEPGTGKTHLATALGMAAAQQGRKVRFATAAALMTELVEARDANVLARTVKRYGKVDLLILDELAYFPVSQTDAELLFRVLGERQERKPLIVTTNLPFSEWTTMFPDARLCRAIVDRMTHRAHIIDTGTTSQRLAETLIKSMASL